ncbi:MAG TPA: beta-ketoacyl synthase N-terminal-like domain-containing protein [Polyangiaceae bacterium]|nr:beta-ketoacyl synthase N-terminal-like domain-containing protein [Polyangiaceae bacterium]
MEPIAIIGLGCRFAGSIDDPQSFWRLIREGGDASGSVPADRWDADAFHADAPVIPGKIASKRGHFLDGIDRFDAAFFGIARPEAARMDPQQRLLLEVAWEALESAGLPQEKMSGTSTGVFVGISNSDYDRMLCAHLPSLDAYSGVGTNYSVAPSRLSYFFNLRGPSIAVDTGCSSALVAMHLACQALRSGECDFALCGGVNVILAPEKSVTLSQAGLLAPDGRCKTFAECADGYGRGEGCGIVVLKRLVDAERDGDTVLASIRGSAVNHDGLSNGLTSPSSLSQQTVIRQALKNASIAPSRVGYVETHGTGTVIGDAIEVKALHAVLVPGRTAEQKCALGAIKANIGHTEPASGIAAVIKVILSLRARTLVPHPHRLPLNPHLPLQGEPLYLPERLMPWVCPEGTRIAGVSAFSFCGTNCHVVMEEAPQRAAAPASYTKHLLTLRAKSQNALRALASRYALAVANCDDLAVLCYSANTAQSEHDYRLALVGTRETLRSQLEIFAAEATIEGGWTGVMRARRARRIAFAIQGGKAEDLDAPAFLSARQRARDAGATETFAGAYGVASLFASWGIVGAGEDPISCCVNGHCSLEEAIHRPMPEPARGSLVVTLGAASWDRLLGQVAEIFVRGGRVDFRALRPAPRQFLPTYPFERQRHWIGTSDEEKRPATTTSAAAAEGLRARIESALPHEREDVLATFLRSEIAAAIGSTEELYVRQTLFDLGVTSRMAIALKNRIETALHLSLHTTIIFDYPTIEALSRYLVAELGGAPPAAPMPMPTSASTSASALDALSEAELAALLADKIEKLRKSEVA